MQFAFCFALALFGLGVALNHVGQPPLRVVNFFRDGLYLPRGALNLLTRLLDLLLGLPTRLLDLLVVRRLLLLLLAIDQRLDRFEPRALDVVQYKSPTAPLLDV